MDKSSLMERSKVIQIEVLTLSKKIARQIPQPTMGWMPTPAYIELEQRMKDEGEVLGWIARDALYENSFTSLLIQLKDGTLFFKSSNYEEAAKYPQIFLV